MTDEPLPQPAQPEGWLQQHEVGTFFLALVTAFVLGPLWGGLILDGIVMRKRTAGMVRKRVVEAAWAGSILWVLGLFSTMHN